MGGGGGGGGVGGSGVGGSGGDIVVLFLLLWLTSHWLLPAFDDPALAYKAERLHS